MNLMKIYYFWLQRKYVVYLRETMNVHKVFHLKNLNVYEFYLALNFEHLVYSFAIHLYIYIISNFDIEFLTYCNWLMRFLYVEIVL